MTTQWRSPFTSKNRTVEIWQGDTSLWADSLGLSATSPSIEVGGTGTHVQVNVDADGVVTLSTADGASGAGLEVVVDLDDTDAASQTQITAITAFGAYQNDGTAYSGDPNDSGTLLTFDASTGAATPATVIFDAYTPGPDTGAYLSVRLRAAT